jgi:hypothetical protein
MICTDMNRPALSGKVIVTSPASRSKTAAEYRVSRFCRITIWSSTGESSRKCRNCPNPPAAAMRAK